MGSGFIHSSADRPAALIPSIESRLIEDLFHNAKGVVVATLALYALNYAFYATVLPLNVLLFWSSLMLGACVLRITSIWRYEKFCELYSSARWHNEMALSYLLIAIGWAFLAVYSIVFLTEGDAVLAIVTVSGIAGSSAATTSASPVIFKLVTYSSLMPLTITLLLSSHDALPYVGAMSFCYLVVLNRTSARIHDTLVQNVTFGLQNETLVQTLAVQSTVDSLTGLSNRRALNTSFQEAWASAELDGKSVGLILCDIDHFKEYNDKHGHLEGDRCLQQVAQAMQSVTRSGDLTAARYGGEEFAVLLPSCDPGELERVAERLRSAVQGLGIVHGKSSVSDHVTISIGVSHLEPGSRTATDDLIRAADRALYLAKEGGRNLVRLDA